MQLCLDGKDPINRENDNFTDNPHASVTDENIQNVIGLKGMKGIENYLKIDKPPLIVNNKHTQKLFENESKDCNNLSGVMHMSPSYADTVSALLKSPQPQLPSSINKENDNTLCTDIKGAENESGLKLGRKRSLTEMIGHNPLSKERKPLGQKRCFETDL